MKRGRIRHNNTRPTVCPLSLDQNYDTYVDAEDEDKYLPVNDDPMSHLILDAIKNDELRKVSHMVQCVLGCLCDVCERK